MTGRADASAFREALVRGLGVALCLFTLAEVNYPLLTPQSELAIFAGLGLVLCFLLHPLHRRWRDQTWCKVLDGVLAVLALSSSAWIVIQNEPAFRSLWLDHSTLGDRAGVETGFDFAVGVVGLIIVLEGTRRVVGPALPLVSLAFLAYGYFGRSMPGWLFPHRGYGVERLVDQTYLHTQGVFGLALNVMFTYVFLFVIFGGLLELTGATGFIIDWTQRLFRGSPGGPAKVAVISSGLMGSLSGSAVANVATTGTFTIPLMKSAGFRAVTAAGIESAASSGGALMPPVMGAGAYMMLELIDPPVTYLQIIRAALIPAILYYLSLFLFVHFRAHRLIEEGRGETPGGDDAGAGAAAQPAPAGAAEGWIFFASLTALVGFLLAGWSVFRSVTLAMGVTLVLSFVTARTRLTWSKVVRALDQAARSGITLVAAAACVGIVLGVVTLTGIGSKLPATIVPLAEHNLFLALVLIMVSSIVLGMGLPSAVCYLLLATIIGPALGDLGVVPLSAHFFIFYFGLMSMVTPPVALAAYTASAIAKSPILETSWAAFRFALIGFVLPYLFVYRPELLMLEATGAPASWMHVVVATALVALAIVPLAAAMAGHLWGRLAALSRAALLASSFLLLVPARSEHLGGLPVSGLNLAGVVLLFVLIAPRLRNRHRSAS